MKKYIVASITCLLYFLISCTIFSVVRDGFKDKKIPFMADGHYVPPEDENHSIGFYIFGIFLFVTVGILWKVIIRHYSRGKNSKNRKTST